jgi:hypothetical protein
MSKSIMGAPNMEVNIGIIDSVKLILAKSELKIK